MTITSQTFTLNNLTPTLIVAGHQMVQEVFLHNMTKSSNQYVHLGGSSMTVADSIHIDPGESLTLTLVDGDNLFAMSNPTGLVVGVMTIRKNA